MDVKDDMYDYGKHLGLAFQIVDDILDFTQTEEQLRAARSGFGDWEFNRADVVALQADDRLKGLIETKVEDLKDLG